ncbi:50S ribosomal protein L19 [Patescibacteria group bacterium]|nr:50S ribosomal protein L19 [Patescibacteria group bacterium]
MFKPGYTIKVGYKIIEAGKERIQPFEGVVISKRGEGFSKTFMVRHKGAKNIGVERIFQLFSPKIAYITVIKKARARRAKLYYLRENRSRQDSKIKEVA